MATVIFKTSSEHLAGVLRTSKHALRGRPMHLQRGDMILLAKLVEDLRPEEPQIQFSMLFERARRDSARESDDIWGRHWPWIIDCSSLKSLTRPFNIKDHQVTTTNYSTGGTVVYVEHEPLNESG